MSSYILNHQGLCLYTLQLSGKHRNVLYKYLSTVINHTVMDSEDRHMSLTCGVVLTLRDYITIHHKLSIENTISMIDCLSDQLTYLKTHNLGYYGLNLDDILVIDDDKYIICDTSKLLNISNDKLQINCLIKPCGFSSREMEHVLELPAKVDYRCIFYSIGLLVLFSLLQKRNSNIPRCLEGTKFEWFLQRCFKENPCERQLLLI